MLVTQSVTNILNRSPRSQSCPELISSPTSVTNIDVAVSRHAYFSMVLCGQYATSLPLSLDHHGIMQLTCHGHYCAIFFRPWISGSRHSKFTAEMIGIANSLPHLVYHELCDSRKGHPRIIKLVWYVFVSQISETSCGYMNRSCSMVKAMIFPFVWKCFRKCHFLFRPTV